MNFLMLPVHRPVAVAMFFVGIMMLGGVAWMKMPVELFPSLLGNQISVQFQRPGSDPEVIEREILLPLQAQVSSMSGVSETWGEIRGPNGRFDIRFETGVDIKVREFEIQRVVTEMQREQPRGTWMNVQAASTGAFSDLAMVVHVLGSGADDRDALYDLVDQMIAPRFAAISGVSQAIATGGAKRQVTVTVDPDRTVARGLTTEQVSAMVQRNVGRMRYVGGMEDETGRTAVILDGRPVGVHALANSRVTWNNPALLRHVSDVELGFGQEERLFRVNGQPAVGLVIFQEQGSNLVRLGRTLRERVEEVRGELRSQGLDLVISNDAAEIVEDQISHLSQLGASGFGIALIVLYFFLRQWRAVAVVGLAVPVSLLTALSFLYLLGLSLNLVSLFGLMLAIGLVVDNSVVVFEAIQRHLERGQPIEEAVREGLSRTVRAIVAASATTAVVFLPLAIIEFDDELIASMIRVVSLSILLPLVGSLLVAIGLVPLLAHRLAAPAATSRLDRSRERRQLRGNLVPPDQARILFSGIVASALRHPPSWLAGTVAAVLLTAIVALPWVTINAGSQEASQPDSLQLEARFPSDRSIEQASKAIGRLEQVLLNEADVQSVEAQIEKDGGALTIRFVDREERSLDFNAGKFRNLLQGETKKIKGLELLRPGDQRRGQGGGNDGGADEAFGSSPAEIVLSGPDSRVLQNLATSVEAQLESLPQVEDAWASVQPGMSEYWVEPIREAFESIGLTFDQVLPVLNLAGREGQQMQTGFVLQNGRELPLVIERTNARETNVGMRDLSRLRVQTDSGVLPVAALATMRKMPPPAMISHHNGRREISVMYRLDGSIPQTGPTRIGIEEQIAESIRAIPRPRGTSIETQEDTDATSWFRKVALPAIGLLFLVLAMTFESLTLPILVMLALPLTLLGSIWALAFAGLSVQNMMALLGALVLVGLTVNPAILLVDRMQQLIRNGNWSLGAAAFGAVRERTRPVLMTTATTIAGLWPLAITTGRENEIWPPFATVVMGGLITSSLLTLLIMPVGFILLRRVDQIFSRVGPWLVLLWLASTGATLAALILSETITSLLWQGVLALLIGSAYLAVVVIIFRPKEVPEPDCSTGPPTVEVRHLYKSYGLPGALKSALLAPRQFARKVVAQGGRPFMPSDARERLIPLGLATIGVSAIAWLVQSAFWQLFFWLVVGVLVTRLLIETLRSLGSAEESGEVIMSRWSGLVTLLIPWSIIGTFAAVFAVTPHMAGAPQPGVYVVCILFTVLVAAFQGMRHNARLQATGVIPPRIPRGGVGVIINLWRALSARLAGLDLPVNPTRALSGVSFSINKGMIGVLGPNGAGKTTLLRQLAGVLDPTRGTIHIGGVPMQAIQRHLARWVGYLPQEAGLPGGMSPREYLTWYAALYDLPPEIRDERVTQLIEEVGLSEKTDVRISELSGGMRQRVAVARTLLRLPPIIIVDEPTVGLDPRERIRFRNLLSRLARDRIVMMSTHVVEDVAVACDRVLVFSNGDLVFDGNPETLSQSAEGLVWEVRTRQGDPMVLPEDAIHTHETPAADGSIINRVITNTRPSDDASPLEPSLEDGYMWLLSQSGATT